MWRVEKMVVKVLKTNSLVLNYEYLSEEGKNLTKKQSFNFLPLAASIDDFYNLGVDISAALKAPIKSIEQNTVSILMEE